MPRAARPAAIERPLRVQKLREGDASCSLCPVMSAGANAKPDACRGSALLKMKLCRPSSRKTICIGRNQTRFFLV